MNRTTLPVAILVTICAMARPTLVHADCTPIAHAEEVLKPGAHLHIGEMHGNAETPLAVGELACLALALKGPVRVALEIPAEEAQSISTFVASTGSAADRAALLRGKFWTDAFQDGRRSRAMIDLLERVRQLRSDGGDVQIVVFDAQAEDRDQVMAERLATAIKREPTATFVILSGNLHARRKLGQIGYKPPSLFMAEHVIKRGVNLISLDARYGSGSTWACFGKDSCGPAAIGRGAGQPLAIVLKPSPDGAYDGVLDVGVPSFSPPAAVQLSKKQQAMADALKKKD